MRGMEGGGGVRRGGVYGGRGSKRTGSEQAAENLAIEPFGVVKLTFPVMEMCRGVECGVVANYLGLKKPVHSPSQLHSTLSMAPFLPAYVFVCQNLVFLLSCQTRKVINTHCELSIK